MLMEKIKAIYSELTDDDFHPDRGTISLRDNSDGNGPFIEKWEHPTLARPTQEQLEGAA